MCCSRHIFICLCLLILNVNSLFSGLLPDNIVLVSKNTYCSVKDLDLGKQVISLGSTEYNLRDRYSYISGVRITGGCTKHASLLTLESAKRKISSLMVGQGQRFCVLTDDSWANQPYMWVEAQRLEPGMFILGYNNTKFKVRDVQEIEFKSNTDSYEISLSQYNTFYIIDSNGNPILTHNVLGLLGWIIIGALIGGVFGAGISIYKAYARNVSISASSVLKGFLIGAVTGAVAAAVTYYGIYLGSKYILPMLDKCRVDLALRYPTLNPGSTMSAIMEKWALIKYPQLEAAKKVFFVGLSTGIVAPLATKMGYNVIDQTIEDFVRETERREGENINFVETNIRHKKAKRNALNRAYVEVPSDMEILATETLRGIDGNPIKDQKGNELSIILAAVNNN